jgi:hypothetical protein
MAFKLDGNILASKDIDSWPVEGNSYLNLFEYTNCTNMTLTGEGQIIGFGYDWWLGSFTGKHDLYHLRRPILI